MLEKQDIRKNRRHSTLDGSNSAGPGRQARDTTRPTGAESSKERAAARKNGPGLPVRRFFTKPGDDGFTNVQWELRTAAITGENGKMVFEQRDVEVPKGWSQTATNVVVQKYFRGTLGTPTRERSVRQLISRVADTITTWGLKDGYFADAAAAEAYNAELRHLLVEQKMSFNSPVWFNVGSEAEPQCSACFINSVEDRMESILTSGQDRGHAVQVRLGHGHQPVAAAQLARAAERRRHRVGSGQLHARLRRLRRRDQVGRQDPARREDGDPQHRSPRRRGVHLVQGQGREEGLDAHRRRLRRLVRWRSVQVDLLPELEQLGARHRRFHGGGAEGPRVGHARRARRAARRHLQGARPVALDRRRGLAVRRPRPAVRHHGQRLAHLGEHRAHQRVEPVLRVHVPRRLGLQPGVAEPAQVPEARR